MLVGRISRERPHVSLPALRIRWLDRQVEGHILALSGTLADLVAGWFMLDHLDARWILVHIPAVLVWTLGLHILRRSGASQVDALADQTGADVHNDGWLARLWKGRIASTLCRPELVALLLGLVLFPGLIPLGWYLALGLACAQRMPRRTGLGFVVEESVPDNVSADRSVPDSTRRPSVPARHTEIASLADAVRDPRVEVRRGAIALLGQLGTSDAVAVLRGLLTDSHADVRLDASITLARLEAKYSRAVNDAAKVRLSSPSSLRAYASQCLGYGCSGLLDPVSSRFYLTEARTALYAYLAQDSESAEIWVMAARLHMDLGEMAEALDAIDHAISSPDPPAEALLLAMEIAFRQRKWERLNALAGQVCQAPCDMDEKLEVMRWWAEMPGETPDKRPSGAMR